MNYPAYRRLVNAYHSCDTRVAHDVMDRNGALSPSENDYDWLGHGIYFWEHGPARALKCAAINWTLGLVEVTSGRFQSLRGLFQEGDLAFPNSAIRRKSHI